MYSLRYKLKDELNWYFDIQKLSPKCLIIDNPIANYSLGGFSDIHYVLDYRETLKVVFRQKGIIGIVSIPILIYKLFKRFFND